MLFGSEFQVYIRLYTRKGTSCPRPGMKTECDVLQYMPLVGVPSFIEFSQKRSHQYFFVLIREADNPASPECAKPETENRSLTNLALVRAFEAAADDEPWGSREVAASQESAERKHAKAAAAAAKAAKADRASTAATVALPFNVKVKSNAQ